MTQTRQKLRRDEFDRLIEERLAEQPNAIGHRLKPRLRVLPKASLAEDDVEDLWDNVPL